MKEPDLGRPKFHNLCSIYEQGADDLAAIEEAAGVSRYVFNSLYLGDPVSRTNAEVVLAAFFYPVLHICHLF
jgi:hypothetical protein